MNANAIPTQPERFSTVQALRPAVRLLRRGFTLLELLVVMAITAILLGLIFGPVVQSFNLTNRARTQIEGQAAARNTMDTVSRILTGAVFVYDNAQAPLNMWFADSNGNPYNLLTRFTMIEYVSPARQQDEQPYFTIIDPQTGKPTRIHPVTDPTTGQPIYGSNLPPGLSGYAIPLAPGRSLGRIWMGLADNASQPSTVRNPNDPNNTPWNGEPKRLYANGFEEPNKISNDNRYQLWRAEVAVYIPDPDVQPTQQNIGQIPYVPDLRLFHTSATKTAGVDTKGGALILSDPNFYYDASPAGGKEPGAGTAKWAIPGAKATGPNGTYTIADNWRAVSSPLISQDKADMVALDRNDDNSVKFDPNGKPIVRPLITFAPTFFQNDPGTPTSLENAANESPTPAPTTYEASNTHWSDPFRVIVYRNGANPGDPFSQPNLDYYQYVPVSNQPYDYKIVHIQIPNGQDPPDTTNLPDVGPDIDRNTGFFLNKNPNDLFAFSVDPTRGLVNFSFPSWVYDNDGTNPLPARYSPADVNANLGLDNDPLHPYQKRYLALRDPLPTTPWNGNPLNPGAAISPLNLFSANLGQPVRVRLVPGSERVYGPDQIAGAHYGYRALYTRVSANAGFIGPNQYKINYEDIPFAGFAANNDPRVRIGFIEFNSDWDTASQPNMPDFGSGLSPQEDPANGFYRPHSIPQWKFDTATSQNVPADPFEITYNFQMNRPNDVVKVDYLTRSLMNVAMEVRLYDKATGTPQIISLTNKLKVRNLQH